MADLVPEIDGVSIVLLGAFNAPIFQPAWFMRHGLLPGSADDDFDIQFINNDYCSFRTDWCHVEVLPDRFQVTSQTAPVPEQLRDLVLGTFSVLAHTPIARVGINSHAHFAMPDEATWHSVGHRLVPKGEFWDPILPDPGTLNVTVISSRAEESGLTTQVVVEPSSQVRPGIYVQTNADFTPGEAPDSAKWACGLLSTEWDKAREHADRIRRHIMTLAVSE